MMKYLILSPTKNEEKYIEKTLRSVCAQTIRPVRWIILDDDSTDATPALIEPYRNQYPWIELITLRNFRNDLRTTGGRSGALLNHARELIQDEAVDFVVKIDSDVAFAPDFFERIFREFTRDPQLGLASGHLVQDGRPETIRDWEGVRGATRIYRRACFDAIGSYYTIRGEDEIDTFLARLKGWRTRTLPVPFDHLKPEGVRHPSLVNHFETGEFKGRIPYRFDFFLLTLLKNALARPYVLGSLVQLAAYIQSRWIRSERPFDAGLTSHVQAMQQKKLKSLLPAIGKLLPGLIGRIGLEFEVEYTFLAEQFLQL
ncbi:glycosyltransferase [Larkinella soli]|uniref:glycosyltransferase n=1 Tax=Larkinella soli TaxID=1770527 RepID=UPI000FFBC5D7|nr:glycosyltransferase family A protein [Larkinella soli]